MPRDAGKCYIEFKETPHRAAPRRAAPRRENLSRSGAVSRFDGRSLFLRVEKPLLFERIPRNSGFSARFDVSERARTAPAPGNARTIKKATRGSVSQVFALPGGRFFQVSPQGRNLAVSRVHAFSRNRRRPRRLLVFRHRAVRRRFSTPTRFLNALGPGTRNCDPIFQRAPPQRWNAAVRVRKRGRVSTIPRRRP